MDAFWAPFCIQNHLWNENGEFLKTSVSLTRELNFGGSRDPKAIQKASKNGLKNQLIFSLKKSSKIEAKGCSKGTQNSAIRPPKTIKKIMKKNIKKKLSFEARGGRVDLAGTGGRKAQSGVAPTSI